jgi:hypothetical protein
MNPFHLAILHDEDPFLVMQVYADKLEEDGEFALAEGYRAMGIMRVQPLTSQTTDSWRAAIATSTYPIEMPPCDSYPRSYDNWRELTVSARRTESFWVTDVWYWEAYKVCHEMRLRTDASDGERLDCLALAWSRLSPSSKAEALEVLKV